MSDSSSVARASGVMAVGTLISRVLGFVRAMVLATAIGVTASVGADAFAVGNMLPNNVYMVLVGGVLSAVFVPQIVHSFTHSDGGAKYINQLVTYSAIVLFVVTAAAVALTPLLVRLYATGWSDEQLNLATGFAYWCMPQIFLFGMFNILGEVLNAKKVFGPSSWAPVANNVIVISFLGIYIALFGADPQGVKTVQEWTPIQIALIGGMATLGVVLQACVLMLAWRKTGIRYRPDFNWRGAGFGHLGKIAGWSFAGVIVMQLGGIISTNVASTASGKAASIAALQYAWLIFMLPFSILAFSIGTAYFTKLAEAVKKNDASAITQDISAAMRSIGLVMTLACGVIFMTAPHIAAVVMAGATASDILGLSQVIQMYILALIPYGMLFVIQRAFFAYDDTRTPFYFTVLQIALFATGSIIVAFTVPTEFVAAALALAFTFSTLIQVAVGLTVLARKTGGFEGKRVMISHVRYLVALVPSLVVGWLLLSTGFAANYVESFFSALTSFIAIAAAMVVVFLITLHLAKSEELALVLVQLRSRLGRSS
jgi:putative peptidoglycan lipid II flippase